MKKIIATVAAVLALSACEVPEETATVQITPSKKLDPNELTAGTYQVPQDIKPGTYKTAGPDADDIAPQCYWARLSTFEGDVGDIIANGNTEGPATITIKKSDKGVELSGSCIWKKIK